MGQKVNPISFRLPKSSRVLWHSFNKHHYAKYLHQDLNIRKYLDEFGRVDIHREGSTIKIQIVNPKPIDVEPIKRDLEYFTNLDVEIEVIRLKDAKFLAQEIALFLEKKYSPKQIQKFCDREYKTKSKTNKMKGLRVEMSGRFFGVSMTRKHKFQIDSVPLHTIATKIDFAKATAFTIYGTFGVKVWVNNNAT